MSLLIPGTNSIKDTGYDVANSLRFNQASSDYLNRTNGSSTGKIWTFSCWFKISDPDDTNMNIFSVSSDANSTTYVEVATKSQNGLDIQVRNGSGTTYLRRIPNGILRDVSAWYNVIVRFDSTNGTADDRFRVYVNGTQQTFSTSTGTVDADYVTQIGVSGATVEIGRNVSGSHYYGGYLAEVVLVDGSSLDPTSFGEFDEDSPTIWKPKDVSGLTFGTNGFHLDFENASSLGADVSGNSNNFTVNNLTSIDQSTDTCTNNFTTLNALQRIDDYNFSDGNLTFTNTSAAAHREVHSTLSVSSGKWYAEVKVIEVGGTYPQIGVKNPDNIIFTNFLGNNNGYAYLSDGRKNINTTATSYGNSYTTGDIIGIAMDLDNHKLYFSKNGTFQNSGVPTSGSTGTGAIGLATGVFYSFAQSSYKDGSDPVFSWNFGSPPFSISSGNADANGFGNFEYSVPSGYFSLCTKNLAESG
tara:strand:- start:192 stop:1601 length:1410 start_codon:yes stop_codon:yes gene_type:complete